MENHESDEKPVALGSELNGGLGPGLAVANIAPARMRSNMPITFRLAKRKNGEIVLQGGFHWQEGWNKAGIDWEDLPTVELDA